MTGEVRRMIRGAIGGAALGGGIGGTAFGPAGSVMVGIVGAVRGARDQRLVPATLRSR